MKICFFLQFNWQHPALHWSQLEGLSSGWSNTSRELMDSFLGMRRDLVSQSFLLFCGVPRGAGEGWAYRSEMKNTEKIVFAVKTQADCNISLWGSRRFCQVIRQRGTREARRLPVLWEKETKNPPTKHSRLVPWPLVITGGHEKATVAVGNPPLRHHSQRSTHDLFVSPFIGIVTWKQTSVISNDLYKTSKMHIKNSLYAFV